MSSIEVFFQLVRIGLFGSTESAESILQDDVDWEEIEQLAKEQCVIGLVVEGMESILSNESKGDVYKPVLKKKVMKFVSTTMRMEQYNIAMNKFIADLISRMRKNGIEALLLKGQGVAQYYNKPLWRNCGDVDLLLDEENYKRAKEFLVPYATSTLPENLYKKHIGMSISRWTVELHGNLRCGYSSRIDNELDRICDESFAGSDVSSWMNGKVQVPTLGQVNNVVYVFVHFLNHFYKGGIGIRQICDWCRMLWSFRDSLDKEMLEMRVKGMGLMSEWRAFGMFAVEFLGMPKEAMPFYVEDEKWKRKARKILSFILKTGNMGHNRNRTPIGGSLLKRKKRSAIQRVGDLTNHLMIFPLDTIRFIPSIFVGGLRQK